MEQYKLSIFFNSNGIYEKPDKNHFLKIKKNPKIPGIMAFTICETKETNTANVGDMLIILKRYVTIASPVPNPLIVKGNNRAIFINGDTARM